LLKVGVDEAMRDAGFDNQAFVDRGGVFDWSRDAEPTQDLDW
jgi:radical S-adenosyl methionine domain-containing protein 2